VAFWYLRFAISPRSAIGAEARHLPKAITRKTAAITRIAAAIFCGCRVPWVPASRLRCRNGERCLDR